MKYGNPGAINPQKCLFWPKKSFTWLLGVNLYSNLQMNAFIVFGGSKHMGNDISLIILVISDNFQDGGSAAHDKEKLHN